MLIKKIKGFSLVELLISLIVISCITAAFAPLITKKFSSSVFGGGSVSDITTECSDKFSSDCTLCTSNFCIACTRLSCGADEFKDTKSCSCKKCVDKYGTDCAKCNEKKCLTCPEGEYLDSSDENCKKCSDKFSNCTSCDENKCLSCKNGYILDSLNSNNSCVVFDCNGDDFIQVGSLCITKKNMGDGNKLIIPDGVNVVQVDQSCSPSSSNKCCWQGNTSASSCDNSNGGGYSGCNRTVCDWWAADYICKNFHAGNYTWRLATKSEISGWANNSKDKGTSGLQLCDNYSGYSSAYCDWTSRCPGAGDSYCLPYNVWSGNVTGSSGACNYYLDRGSWNQVNNYRTYAFSVRCVSEMPQSCAQKISEGCLSCDGSSCLSCDSGYILKDGVCKVDCASKFGSSCSECNLSQCTKCADGYHMTSNQSANPACESDFPCSGEDFMQIGNLCITRKNMGDSVNLPIASGVNIKQINQNCSPSSSNKCCWQGNTSGSSCDNENGGGYSGCNRTVCDWWAADYICKNFHAGNYTWRLATTSEMSGWANNSIGIGTNGLQLCDYYSGYSSAYCYNSNRCPGSRSGCYPRYVWSGDEYNSSNAYSYYLNRGSWNQLYDYRTRAFSVRCVTEL